VDTATLLIIASLVASAAVLVRLLAITWRNRADAIAPWFAATILAFLVWTVGYIFELVSPDLSVKIWWADVQFIGIAVLPVAWFEVVRRYTGRGSLPRWVSVLLGSYVVVSLVMVFVNPAGAFRGAPSLDFSKGLTMLEPDYGWYWSFVFTPVMYLLLAATVGLLVQSLWSDRQSLYRRQYVLLLVAGLLPLVAGSVYIAGLVPVPGLNPTTAVVSVSGAIMAYALFRYRLFGIVPVARDAVVDDLADGVIVLDTYDRIVDFNPAARQLFPDLGREALGRPVAEVLAFHPGLLQSIEQATAAEPVPHAVVAELSMSIPRDESPGAPAESRHLTLALTPVHGRTGRLLGHSVLLHDVTRSVELLRQVERLATTDPLTELLTRTAFLELGEREMTRARGQGFAVWLLLLDLDHFSLVNDLYGAESGDEVLRAVAIACRRNVQAFDLIGRYGGAQYALLLPHLSRQEAGRVAERLCRAVEGVAVSKDDQFVTVTASVGLAGTERAKTEYLSDLLVPAEKALREARRQGRNRVACDDVH
jgi:diguanylate cyclase (GGDEF)-like protein